MEKEEGGGTDFLFVIDTTPKIESDVPVPRFKSKFQVLTESAEEEPDQKKPKRKGFLQSCFNCGSNEHSLRDCKDPYDQREVARNRKIFMDSKNSKNNGIAFQRYHIDEEQRFAHFKPGTISKKLRSALGITSYQLPPYIYNMRQLGYPLGWLEEIRVSHSGITMFDGSGKEVEIPGDEEGEVVCPRDNDKYDIRKIISYPGFNVPPPSNVTDEYERFGAPPLNMQQSKEALIQVLKDKDQTAYCRKKFPPDDTEQNVNDSTQSNTDMDVEDTPEVGLLPEDNCGFVPPLPEDKAVPPPPPDDDDPSADNSKESSSSQSMGDDVSLQELESRKSELLAELNDTSCANTPLRKSLGKIKTVDLGTPVLKSVSPYSRLPSANSFSADICDVINFENLPDSTGKYEKMSGLIRKLRTQVSKLQNETR